MHSALQIATQLGIRRIQQLTMGQSISAAREQLKEEEQAEQERFQILEKMIHAWPTRKYPK